MKTTITNKFHGYKRIIKHRGELPSLSNLRRALRAAKPADCMSPTDIYREDGAALAIVNFGQGPEVVISAE